MPQTEDQINSPLRTMEDRRRREEKNLRPYREFYGGEGAASVPDIAEGGTFDSPKSGTPAGDSIRPPTPGTFEISEMAGKILPGVNIYAPSPGTATAAITPPSGLDRLLEAPTSRNISNRVTAEREFMAARGIKPSEKSKYERALAEERSRRESQARRDDDFRREQLLAATPNIQTGLNQAQANAYKEYAAQKLTEAAIEELRKQGLDFTDPDSLKAMRAEMALRAAAKFEADNEIAQAKMHLEIRRQILEGELLPPGVETESTKGPKVGTKVTRRTTGGGMTQKGAEVLTPTDRVFMGTPTLDDLETVGGYPTIDQALEAQELLKAGTITVWDGRGTQGPKQMDRRLHGRILAVLKAYAAAEAKRAKLLEEKRSRRESQGVEGETKPPE